MKKVVYRVTKAFGVSPVGELRYAFLVFQDGNQGLLYHPREGGLCASLEMCECHYTRKLGEYWISAKEPYVNVDTQRDLNRVSRILSRIRYSAPVSNLIVEK